MSPSAHKAVLLFGLYLASFCIFIQGDEAYGRSFVFVFPSYMDLNQNEARLQMTTWAELTVFVNVSFPGSTKPNQTVTVKRGASQMVDIPVIRIHDDTLTPQIILGNNTVLVEATDDIYLYTIGRGPYGGGRKETRYGNSDGFLVLPIKTLGKVYYAMSYDPFEVLGYLYSEFVLCAIEDDTNITINSPHGILNALLRQYESYQFMDGIYDVSGTLINATKPIAVISGHFGAAIPFSGKIDLGLVAPVFEMMPPVDRFVFGNYTYILSAFPNQFYPIGFTLRVIGTASKTIIHIRSNPGKISISHTIGPGEVYEPTDTSIMSTPNDCFILTSSHPVVVMQMANNHPSESGPVGTFMFTIPSVTSFTGDVIIPIYEGEDNDNNYISITTKCNLQSGLKLNNKSIDDLSLSYNFSIDDWCVFHTQLTPDSTGVHTVTHSSTKAAFYVIAYGIATLEDAYGLAFAYPANYRLPEIVTEPNLDWLWVLFAAILFVLVLLLYLTVRKWRSITLFFKSFGAHHVERTELLPEVPEGTMGRGTGDIAGEYVEPPKYKMNSVPRGKCLIINNRNFRAESWHREGSERDAEKLEEVFTNLGFEILKQRFDNISDV